MSGGSTSGRMRWAWESFQILLASLAAGLFLKIFVVDACRVQSASMEQTLLPGDFVIINKLGYGVRALSRLPFLGAAIPALLLPPFRTPEVGDVLVFHPPDPAVRVFPPVLYVKRCVGGPGDTILVERGSFYINGRKLTIDGEEARDTAESLGPVVIPWRGMRVPLEGGSALGWKGFIEREGHTLEVRSGGGGVLIDGRPEEAYVVERQYYFMAGDNRSRSVDSRHWGPVPEDAIVGRAALVYWSQADGAAGSTFWERLASVRLGRLGRLVR